jgi:HTH-type transcriptional regulator/antitoxin HigA
MSETDLKSVLEATRHTQSDLARLVGSRSRASEYLNGKRAVPLGDRRLLMSQWGVSAETVVMLPLKALSAA